RNAGRASLCRLPAGRESRHWKRETRRTQATKEQSELPQLLPTFFNSFFAKRAIRNLHSTQGTNRDASLDSCSCLQACQIRDFKSVRYESHPQDNGQPADPCQSEFATICLSGQSCVSRDATFPHRLVVQKSGISLLTPAPWLKGGRSRPKREISIPARRDRSGNCNQAP